MHGEQPDEHGSQERSPARDTAWALLPVEISQASVDKDWNQCTPTERIGILWNTGVLK